MTLEMALQPFKDHCKWLCTQHRCSFDNVIFPRDISSTSDDNFKMQVFSLLLHISIYISYLICVLVSRVFDDYYENDLSCKFPDKPRNGTDWSELINLIEISISNNDRQVMTGHFPPFLLQPPALLKLTVSQTKFTGKLHLLPWQNSGELQQVDVRNNRLSGHLPPDLFKQRHIMTSFNAANNLITGGIPSNFDMSQLTKVCSHLPLCCSSLTLQLFVLDSCIFRLHTCTHPRCHSSVLKTTASRAHCREN